MRKSKMFKEISGMLLAVFLGIVSVTQGGVNSQLGKSLESAAYGTLFSFIGGLIGLSTFRLIELWQLRRAMMRKEPPKVISVAKSPAQSLKRTLPPITVGDDAKQAGEEELGPHSPLIPSPPATSATTATAAAPSVPATAGGSCDDDTTSKPVTGSSGGAAADGTDADQGLKPLQLKFLYFRRKPKVWQLCGGVLGVAFVGTIAYLAPVIGFGLLSISLTTGQLTCAVMLDHVGFLGARVLRVNKFTIAGILTLVAGSSLFAAAALGTDTDHSPATKAVGVIVSIAAGALVTVQASVNRSAADIMPSAVSGAIVSFIGGGLAALVVSIIMLFALPDTRKNLKSNLEDADWYLYFGGFLGMWVVLGAIHLPRIIGYATFSTCMVLGQLVSSILYDGVAFLRDDSEDPTLLRLLGAGLALVATLLFRKSTQIGVRRLLRANLAVALAVQHKPFGARKSTAAADAGVLSPASVAPASGSVSPAALAFEAGGAPEGGEAAAETKDEPAPVSV